MTTFESIPKASQAGVHFGICGSSLIGVHGPDAGQAHGKSGSLLQANVAVTPDLVFGLTGVSRQAHASDTARSPDGSLRFLGLLSSHPQRLQPLRQARRAQISREERQSPDEICSGGNGQPSAAPASSDNGNAAAITSSQHLDSSGRQHEESPAAHGEVAPTGTMHNGSSPLPAPQDAETSRGHDTGAAALAGDHSAAESHSQMNPSGQSGSGSEMRAANSVSPSNGGSSQSGQGLPVADRSESIDPAGTSVGSSSVDSEHAEGGPDGDASRAARPHRAGGSHGRSAGSSRDLALTGEICNEVHA